MIQLIGLTVKYVQRILYPGKVHRQLINGLLKLYASNMKQCDITDTLEVDPMIVNSIEELFQKMRMNSDIRMLWRLMMQEYHLVIGKKYVLISIVVYFSSDLIIIISLDWSISLQIKQSSTCSSIWLVSIRFGLIKQKIYALYILLEVTNRTARCIRQTKRSSMPILSGTVSSLLLLPRKVGERRICWCPLY